MESFARQMRIKMKSSKDGGLVFGEDDLGVVGVGTYINISSTRA